MSIETISIIGIILIFILGAWYWPKAVQRDTENRVKIHAALEKLKEGDSCVVNFGKLGKPLCEIAKIEETHVQVKLWVNKRFVYPENWKEIIK